MPSSMALVEGATALAAASPTAAFALTDMLRAHCNAVPEQRDAVMDSLLSLLAAARAPVDGAGPSSGNVDPGMRLFAVSHLLATLLADHPPSREAAAQKGTGLHAKGRISAVVCLTGRCNSTTAQLALLTCECACPTRVACSADLLRAAPADITVVCRLCVHRAASHRGLDGAVRCRQPGWR
jgi:hypothetical protein